MTAGNADEADKILLMGLAETGKTTIIKVITEGYVLDEDAKYAATVDYKRKELAFLGKQLTFFDLGGQKSFLDRFTGELAQFIFSKAKVLVYVVDIANLATLSRAKYYLDLAIDRLHMYSPKAAKYVFLHKKDLLEVEKLEEITKHMKTFLMADLSESITFFNTTAFDESIYNAFGRIFAGTTETGETIESMLVDFIKDNKGSVSMAQLFTKEGIPLINSSNFTYVTLNQIRDRLQDTLQLLGGAGEKLSSTTIESADKIYIIRFLKNDSSLFLSLSREEMKKNNVTIQAMNNSVLMLTEKLNSII